MKNSFEKDLRNYCSEDTINNLYNNHPKSVGLKCIYGPKNENNKMVGQVLYITEIEKSKQKFKLGDFVEFDEKFVNWSSSLDSDGFGIFMVRQHFCRKYTVNPYIDVDVKVYRPKTKTYGTENISMNYSEYMKRRLLDFYGNWKHRVVVALENYDIIRSKRDHMYALNATVKHYGIELDYLKSALAQRNRKVLDIKRDWIVLKND